MDKFPAGQFVGDHRYHFFVEPSWTSELVFFFFVHATSSFQTLVVLMTIHDTLLTTCGRRGFIFFLRFRFLSQCSECARKRQEQLRISLKVATEHNNNTTPQHTTQQVHQDNLFLHQASNSPTNEGPRPTHSGPQGKWLLHRELSGRVIIVTVIGRDEQRERDRKKKEKEMRDM